MDNKLKRHYKANKKIYYVNLRSTDSDDITLTTTGNKYKFSWNIKNIHLSPQARLCITSCAYYDPSGNNPSFPVNIRCKQVNSTNVFDSSYGEGTIIYMANPFESVNFENWYPVNTQVLDRIDLLFTNQIASNKNGLEPDLQFYIQLKIEDYDIEEVNPNIMPQYNPNVQYYSLPHY